MPVLTKSGWNCQSAGGKRCFRWASKLFLTSMGKSGICNSSWGSATPFRASWTRRTQGSTVTLTTKSRALKILKFSTPTIVTQPRPSCGPRIYNAWKTDLDMKMLRENAASVEPLNCFLTSMGKSGDCNLSWGSATPFKASWTRRTWGGTVTLTTKSRAPKILNFSTLIVVTRPRPSCGPRTYIA